MKRRMPAGQQGFVLVVAVFVVAILCLLIVSYLPLVYADEKIALNADSYNGAYFSALAGVEYLLWKYKTEGGYSKQFFENFIPDKSYTFTPASDPLLRGIADEIVVTRLSTKTGSDKQNDDYVFKITGKLNGITKEITVLIKPFGDSCKVKIEKWDEDGDLDEDKDNPKPKS
ncbi:MAG: hypothetical protein PWQ91_1297 [Eubacteriales bacterium]|nr:hypothetical protein [Eubacteriales bacterium]MDN5364235.1 hypothetical protein [Eubacteriales bacterium]